MEARRGGFTPGRMLSALLGQRAGAPPEVQRFLFLHANYAIVGMSVHREPITQAYEVMTELLTLGQWGDAKRASGYDRVFHLAFVIKLRDRQTGATKSIVLDKRPVVKIREGTMGGESVQLALPRDQNPLYLQDLLARTAHQFGAARFWNYDARTTNCQDFVLQILTTWNLLTPQLYQFVKQPMSTLLKHWLTNGVVSFVTDTASRADILVHGGCTLFPCL